MNTSSTELQSVNFDATKIRRIVDRVFAGYTGSLGVRLWDGVQFSLGRDNHAATLVIKNVKLFRKLIWRPDPLRLVEAYFFGEFHIEGDLYAFLKQSVHLQSLRFSMHDRISMLFAALFPKSTSAFVSEKGFDTVRYTKPVVARLTREHSKTFNRQAIAFHYDVSNEFYRLWLDEQRVYSCAYFTNTDESLEQAQRNKLDHICRKLRLKTGERLLDIGCGWGALICWAAQHYGVYAHGITLSRQQYEFTRAKIRDLGLEKQVTVELRDYRDLPNDTVYDKVSSIGMFEHVGLKNLPTYTAIVQRVLKRGGLFLNHGITDNENGKQKSVGTEFIKRYVFPDGELDSMSNVQSVMEQANFEICDVEALRCHYALTLRHWVNRLEAQHKEALTHVSEATYRVWRLYMAGSALQFERGAIGVYQILAVNGRDGCADLPLTRHDLYL